MVTDNHFRWDFIGLSTDEKPTPATSEKVVDGSTFYCSDTSKLYVYCKDNWYERKPLGGGGGGTTYTAGDGIDITDDTISIDDDVVATLEELNARIAKGEGAPTTATEGVVGGLYEDNTNGKLYICTAITPGTDPDPDTYTWAEVGAGGGGGDIVYSTKNTSNGANGGAVYIGGKDAAQQIYLDPSTTDNHRRFFWALPFNTSETGQNSIPGSDTVNIGGDQSGSGERNVTLGYRAKCAGDSNVMIGYQAGGTVNGSCVCIGDTAECLQNYGVALGRGSRINSGHTGSVALGAQAKTTRGGEVYVGTNNTNLGYNSTNYRVIGGVHDGQLAQDAVTVAQVNATIDAINTALSTNIPHIGASS